MKVGHHGGPEFTNNIPESVVSYLGTLELRHIGRAHPCSKGQIHSCEARGQIYAQRRLGEVTSNGSNRFKNKMVEHALDEWLVSSFRS